MWISSRVLDVLTYFLDLKDDLTFFLLMHASHTLSPLNLCFGNPWTWPLGTTLISIEKLTWPSLPCHKLAFSLLAVRQVRSSPWAVYISATYMFLNFFAVKITSVEIIFVTVHLSDRNLTSFPLSHICEILRIFYFNPYT